MRRCCYNSATVTRLSPSSISAPDTGAFAAIQSEAGALRAAVRADAQVRRLFELRYRRQIHPTLASCDPREH
jgi:hypothetical protein